jgi:hypothetical protein
VERAKKSQESQRKDDYVLALKMWGDRCLKDMLEQFDYREIAIRVNRSPPGWRHELSEAAPPPSQFNFFFTFCTLILLHFTLLVRFLTFAFYFRVRVRVM